MRHHHTQARFGHLIARLSHLIGQRAMGRHGHSHGGASFGSGTGGFGEGDGFNRGRKFSSDDLQLLLLALLEEQASHGYELIKLLQARSNGFYSPSPGMVYPALTYLEELGYATIEAGGNKKCYHLTEAGRTYLHENRPRVDAMLAKLAHIAGKMDRIRRAFSGETDGDDEGAGQSGYRQARLALKQALSQCGHASSEEQQRIAAILARATAEILGEPASPTPHSAKKETGHHD
ncbi:helix-turn-helix transcriptional regulator [Chitinimonas arctica]|uniref:Helix-turn-helix transcriptional regulator n=1 Tax=Chitinimonas arctica TaxID=2594795 RepID=A0A516SJZ8_9NEIS|nr:PadR family transcriptional regulator [Chitinimonas arctica]QDQ28474.1 helix-turn-helix transcriptional regulator [Chitinimonas arctica]